MKINQRDIVEVHYDFPGGKSGPHMVIVLSPQQAIEQENGSFLGTVITDSPIDDEFSFWLTNAMMMKPLPYKSQVRLHLINTFDECDVIKHTVNSFRRADFEEMIVSLVNSVFGLQIE